MDATGRVSSIPKAGLPGSNVNVEGETCFLSSCVNYGWYGERPVVAGSATEGYVFYGKLF